MYMVDKNTKGGKVFERSASDSLDLGDEVSTESIPEQLRLLRITARRTEGLVKSTRWGVMVAILLGLAGIIATLLVG